MTHARIPDFTPAPGAVRVVASDPILAAIQTHAEAWSVFQVAPGGVASERAETAMQEALEHLLATPCGSRFGALALVRHLRWYAREEAVTADAEDFFGRLVLMREADLSRFAGSDLLPDMLPVAAPLGRLAPAAERRAPPCRTVAPREFVRRRLLRASGLAGEALAAIAIIGGGAVLTGLATLL
ncbi:hypothetical protein MKK63_24725 [Methylobacterium sp. J-088]|uniref:hypothetical protein n=1 Tax=Methylobacterium sp. J-088 TaxID=2836664 RepID=UPI001FB9E46F|nr:hypothetical protein [Methylobacterium sp. J-088]MCJ2065886.1 hypothetical protein [Methylobacterium sp. J-088]